MIGDKIGLAKMVWKRLTEWNQFELEGGRSQTLVQQSADHILGIMHDKLYFTPVWSRMVVCTTNYTLHPCGHEW